MPQYVPGFEPIDQAPTGQAYAPGFEPVAPAASSRDEAMSIPTLQEAYSTVAEPVTKAVSGMLKSAPAVSPVATLLKLIDPSGYDSASDTSAKFIVPQTPTGGGAALGTAVLGPFGVIPGAIGGAAGAAVGAAGEGKDWSEVGQDAALAGGTNLVLGSLGKLGSWVTRSTGGAKTRIANKDASDLLDFAQEQAPGLGRANLSGETPSAQVRSLATGAGRKGIGAEKEAVTSGIEEAIGGADLYVPSLSKWAGVDNATGQTVNTKVSLRQANEELTAIGDGLRHMDVGDRALRERLIQQDYKKLAGEIRQALDDLQPGLGGVWNVGQEDARAGYALVKMLRNAGAWRAGNSGVEQNTAFLQSKLIDPKVEEAMNWRLKPGGFDDLADTLTRGAGPGNVDINSAGRGGFGQSFAQFGRSPSAGSGSSILTPLRGILPNLGAKYVGAPGRVPYAINPSVQALIDYLGQRAMEQAQSGAPVKIGDTYGR